MLETNLNEKIVTLQRKMNEEMEKAGVRKRFSRREVECLLAAKIDNISLFNFKIPEPKPRLFKRKGNYMHFEDLI